MADSELEEKHRVFSVFHSGSRHGYQVMRRVWRVGLTHGGTASPLPKNEKTRLSKQQPGFGLSARHELWEERKVNGKHNNMAETEPRYESASNSGINELLMRSETGRSEHTSTLCAWHPRIRIPRCVSVSTQQKTSCLRTCSAEDPGSGLGTPPRTRCRPRMTGRETRHQQSASKGPRTQGLIQLHFLL